MWEQYREIIMALLTGLAVGMLFARFKLPVPAPPSLAGVTGIVGIFLGYMLALRLGWGR